MIVFIGPYVKSAATIEFNIEKVFNRLLYVALLGKLKSYGISGWVL